MLNRRGGEPDVVKVLDFGLVKALNETKLMRQSSTMAGTPLYMSPEAIQKPELVGPRSDLYAVGAIGYFLITGQPVFAARTLVDLCHDHIHTVPQAPSQRLGKLVSPELEAALLACLAKSPDARPESAQTLSTRLSTVANTALWSAREASAWWRDYEAALAAAAAVTRQPTTTAGAVFSATAPMGDTQTWVAPPTWVNPLLSQMQALLSSRLFHATDHKSAGRLRNLIGDESFAGGAPRLCWQCEH